MFPEEFLLKHKKIHYTNIYTYLQKKKKTRSFSFMVQFNQNKDNGEDMTLYCRSWNSLREWGSLACRTSKRITPQYEKFTE